MIDTISIIIALVLYSVIASVFSIKYGERKYKQGYDKACEHFKTASSEPMLATKKVEPIVLKASRVLPYEAGMADTQSTVQDVVFDLSIAAMEANAIKLRTENDSFNRPTMIGIMKILKEE